MTTPTTEQRVAEVEAAAVNAVRGPHDKIDYDRAVLNHLPHIIAAWREQQAEIERLRSAYRWVGNKLTRLEAFVEKVRAAGETTTQYVGCGAVDETDYDPLEIDLALADLDAEQKEPPHDHG